MESINARAAPRISRSICLSSLRHRPILAAKVRVRPVSALSRWPKPEDQVVMLLELYARCRQAVEAPVG